MVRTTVYSVRHFCLDLVASDNEATHRQAVTYNKEVFKAYRWATCNPTNLLMATVF